jgi:RNA polymerase sigma factor (sigma-70 family)
MSRSESINTDNHIMMQVKAGHTAMLGLLYERHKQALFGFFYKMCGSTTVSEDLVQIVFMKILHGKDGFMGHGQFITWMFHIARNALHDHYRKHRHSHLELVDSEPDEVAGSADVAGTYDAEQTISQLFAAIDLLSVDKKELLVMSRFQQLKYKQIAVITGSTEGAVKMKMRRTLIELRDRFNELQNGGQQAHERN